MGVESDLVYLVLSGRDGDGPAGAGRTGIADVNQTRGPEDTWQKHQGPEVGVEKNEGNPTLIQTSLM